MKKLILLFVLVTVTSVTFASFPVKVEKSNTEPVELISSEFEDPTFVEHEIINNSIVELIDDEALPAPSRDATWMGIVSISCAALAWAVYWPMAIPAMIFGIIGFNKRLKGLAITGFSLGALALYVIGYALTMI